MSTTNPSSSQPVQPEVVPTVGDAQPGDVSQSKYPSGVTEEEIQIALARRASGGKYWTTEEVLQQLKALEANEAVQGRLGG